MRTAPQDPRMPEYERGAAGGDRAAAAEEDAPGVGQVEQDAPPLEYEEDS